MKSLPSNDQFADPPSPDPLSVPCPGIEIGDEEQQSLVSDITRDGSNEVAAGNGPIATQLVVATTSRNPRSNQSSNVTDMWTITDPPVHQNGDIEDHIEDSFFPFQIDLASLFSSNQLVTVASTSPGGDTPMDPLIRRENSYHRSTPSGRVSLFFPTIARRRPCAKKTLLGIVLATLVCIMVTKFGPLAAPKQQDNQHHSTDDLDRPSQVLDCARTLSIGKGLSEKERNKTSQWQAVNWFLEGGGIQIEVSKPCHWSSTFGIAYGLIVVRQSLGVPDPSWYTDVVIDDGEEERPLQKICRWARIKCNVDKTSIHMLTLNHAGLNGTIPMELMGFTDLDSVQMENNDLLTGTIPPELGNLIKLHRLLLHRTNLSGNIPTSLGRLSALKEFYMDHTNLSGTMPSEICELRKHNLNFLTSDCDIHTRSIVDTTPFVRCNRATCCTYCG